MHDEIKLKMLCLGFPSLAVFGIMLRLDDFLLQCETIPQAPVEHKMRQWNIVLTLSCVADKNGTVSIRFQHTKQLSDTNFQLIEKFGNTREA